MGQFPTWNEFEKATTGNSAEINLYLYGLLRSNGIVADPLWTATRSFGLPIKDFPLISQFNHVLVHIKTQDDSRVVSAIHKNYPIGFINIEENNEYGFFINSDEFRWVSIPEASHNFERITMIAEVGEDGIKVKSGVIL